MQDDIAYDMVYEAVSQAIAEHLGTHDIRMPSRLIDGNVVFVDGSNREMKTIPVATVMKKVTSVREKLRVLEQKINNHGSLQIADKSELQTLISRCYGSLTTFNFLFREESDRFRGSGR